MAYNEERLAVQCRPDRQLESIYARMASVVDGLNYMFGTESKEEPIEVTTNGHVMSFYRQSGEGWEALNRKFQIGNEVVILQARKFADGDKHEVALFDSKGRELGAISEGKCEGKTNKMILKMPDEIAAKMIAAIKATMGWTEVRYNIIK